MQSLHLHLGGSVKLPRRYYFVLRDWERSDFGGEIDRPNLPCVFRCGTVEDSLNGHFTRLAREWQFFMFDLACFVVFGRYHADLNDSEYDWLSHKFTSVFAETTAFCNDHGFDRNINYVTGDLKNDTLPAIYTLVCGGASLAGGVVTNSEGRRILRVDHFDGTKSPPAVRTIDPYSDPRVFWATTITNSKYNGGYGVYKFSQYDGADVAVPLVASSEIFFPMEFLAPYVATIRRSPYNP